MVTKVNNNYIENYRIIAPAIFMNEIPQKTIKKNENTAIVKEQ
jgi:hypothetical protein